jgi:tetratricopeptide (TPR) repeat protein
MHSTVILAFLLAPAADWSKLVDEALGQQRQGRYAEAKQTLRSAWALASREGAPPREVGTILSNLGAVQLGLGEYLEAERTLRRSLMHFRGDAHGGMDETFPLSHLAVLYHETARLRESEDAYRRILSVRQAALGVRDALVAQGQANLASVLVDRGRFEEAGSLMENTLTIFRQLPGTQESQGITLINLAVLRARQGGLAPARIAAEEAVTLFEISGGAGHPFLGKALLTFGRIQLDLGQNVEAERSLQKSVAILETSSPDHPILAEALVSYADALQRSGKKHEAKQARREAAALAAAQLGHDTRRYTVSFAELQSPAKR